MTRPEIRVAPLRDAAYSRLVRCALQARLPPSSEKTAALQSGEVAIVLDGGRSGNKNRYLAPWKEGTVKGEAGKKRKQPEDDDEDALVCTLLLVC